MLLRIVMVMGLALMAGGCASVTRGWEEVVHITSNPSEAEARLSNGMMCITPCALKVNRKDEFSVRVSKPGFEPQEIAVKTRIAGTGALAGVAGNAVLGGLIGFTVDAVSGAALDHCPNPVAVILTPIPGQGRRPGPQMAPRDPYEQCKVTPPDPATAGSSGQ